MDFSLGFFTQQQTSDGGFIIAGGSYSYGNGSRDFMIYKLDAAGKKLWRKNYVGQAACNPMQPAAQLGRLY